MTMSDTALSPRIANLADAAALLKASSAQELELWSPVNAAEVQGVLWFVMLQRAIRAEFPEREVTVVLDCGDRGDLAIEAFRLGLKRVSLRASAGVTMKVADIAANVGGRLYPAP
jgi:hypothetical protein